jgi:cell division protein FtsB
VIRLRPTRLLALGALALVAFLYWKPMQSYLHAKHDLQTTQAEVRSLRQESARLQRRIALADTEPELIRQGRRLGLVRPGERLFIVRGIAAWRHRQHR